MTTSTDTLQPGQQFASSGHTKPLWAAVGILGVAVLGMGGTLIYNQRAPVHRVGPSPRWRLRSSPRRLLLRSMPLTT